MSRKDMLRRLTVVASQQQTPSIPMRFFIEPHQAPKPMDAGAFELAELLEQVVPPSSHQRALWWLENIRPDLDQTANCASMLLVQARWHQNRAERGEDYAWRNLGNRDVTESEFKRLGIA